MEELIFKTVVQTDKSVKETEKLEDSLKGVNDEVKKVDTNAEKFASLNKRLTDGNLTLRESKKLIKDYTDLALQAGRESPIGQEAIKLAGELKDKIGDMRNEVQRAGEDGANLKAALQFGGTLVAGFEVIKGSMAALGFEGKDLEKTMLKLQAATRVLDGIERIRAALEKESLVVTKAKVLWTNVASAAQYVYTTAVGSTTGAMKLLRIAMLAIPIIAIIAGIVALVSALSSFMSVEKEAEETNNSLNESFERQTKLMESNERAYKRQSDSKRALMEAEGASIEQLFAFDKERLMKEESYRRASLIDLEQNIADKKEAWIQSIKEGDEDLTKTILGEIHAQQDKYDELKKQDGQYLEDKKLLEAKYNAEQKKRDEEAQKKTEDEQKAAAQKYKEWKAKQDKEKLEQQHLLEDLLVANIVDSNARKIAQLQLQQKREMDEDVKKYGLKSEVIKQLEIKQASDLKTLKDEISKQAEEDQKNADKKLIEKRAAQDELNRKNEKAMLEGKLIQMREDFDATQKLKLDLALLEMNQELENTNLTEGEIFKIKQEYQEKVQVINKETADNNVKLQKDSLKATQNALQAGLTAGQGLADAFFDYKISKAKKGSAAELEIEKRKFEINKKLQIAQAIMQGIQAVMAAYSSGSAIPVVGAVTGPLFAAVAAATTGLQIAKIKGTQFEGGGGGGDTPSVSAPSVSIPTPDGPQNHGTLTEGLQGSGSEHQTKVVMVDSDLKAALKDNAQVSIVSNVG